MLAPLLRLFALKDVLKVVVETAKIAAAARDVIAESRRRHTAGPQPLAGAAPAQVASEVARLEALVAEHARVMEQAGAQMERLAEEVKRAALRSAFALGAAIVALAVALLVAWLD